MAQADYPFVMTLGESGAPISPPATGRRARGWRRARRAALMIAVALGAIAASASPAAAHATLLQTTPGDEAIVEKAPGTVELRFSESVKASTGGVTVFGPKGDRADRGSVQRRDGGTVVIAPVDASAQGTYTVAWRVTSDDGHTITGSFVFHVGRVTGAVDVDDSTPASAVVGGYVGRWLAYAGSLIVIGALSLRLLARGSTVLPGRLRSLTLGSAAAGLLGAGLLLVAEAAEAAGRDLAGGFGLLGDFVTDQRTGTLGALRLVALAVILGLVALRFIWQRAPLLPLAAAGALVAVTSLAGHAWTASPRWGAVASDVIHLGAVGIWAGGLVALIVVLPDFAERATLARRFSDLALVTVAVVALSGSVSGWAQVRSVEALTSTTYGKLLVTKVAGFAVLVAIGWRNRTRLVALVERTATPLLRSVRREILVAAAVVALTTALVVEPPARVALARPFASILTEGDTILQLTVEPARTGPNDIHMYFFTANGQAPAAVDAVEVEASTTTIPARRLQVSFVTPDHVSAYGASLTAPGAWKLVVTAVRAGAATTFTLEVPIR